MARGIEAMVGEQETERDMEIADDRVPGARLVTARSYLIDRFAPDCEVVLLPGQTVPGGRLHLRTGMVRAEPPAAKGRAARLLGRHARRTETVPAGRRIVDLRHRDPGNWAHFLNNHLPLFFAISAETGLGRDEALLLVPEDTPDYIAGASVLFGLELWRTDAVVEGPGVAFDMVPWVGQRAARVDWVRLPGPRAALAKGLAEEPPPAAPLPRRVFLSRKSTRAPSNGAEVTEWLTQRGFVTLYAEDLSAADQMRLFAGAETIVAVHGAALAPLLYCGPDSAFADAGLGTGPAQLVEILPCGHVTDVYRVIAHRVGCAWLGVRGRIKPEYVQPAYDLGKPFRQFSLDNFEIDIAALDRAFAIFKDDEERRNILAVSQTDETIS